MKCYFILHDIAGELLNAYIWLKSGLVYVHVCIYFAQLSLMSSRLKTQTLAFNTLNGCSHSHLHLAGTILTGTGGGTVVCLRGPQWGGEHSLTLTLVFFPWTSACYIRILLSTDVYKTVPFSSLTATTWPLIFHIVTAPRSKTLQQILTKYFSITDGQDFVSMLMGKWKNIQTMDFKALEKLIAPLCPTALQKLATTPNIWNKFRPFPQAGWNQILFCNLVC